MIKSYDDYVEYLKADKKVNHIDGYIKSHISITWKYLKCLRKLEYLVNCRKGCIARIAIYWYKYKLYKISVKSGITIPINTFGKGLYIPHYGSIVVNPSARFGDYCVVQNDVNISASVTGGNHLYIGTGAKIMIGVSLANDIIIGANAVVNKDFMQSNVVIAGVPAKVISKKGFLNRTII